jgi:hypothetical protein
MAHIEHLRILRNGDVRNHSPYWFIELRPGGTVSGEIMGPMGDFRRITPMSHPDLSPETTEALFTIPERLRTLSANPDAPSEHVIVCAYGEGGTRLFAFVLDDVTVQTEEEAHHVELMRMTIASIVERYVTPSPSGNMEIETPMAKVGLWPSCVLWGTASAAVAGTASIADGRLLAFLSTMPIPLVAYGYVLYLPIVATGTILAGDFRRGPLKMRALSFVLWLVSLVCVLRTWS